MKYIATFFPQTWESDNAVTVNIEQPNKWDVTSTLTNLDDETRTKIIESRPGENPFTETLIGDSTAPYWCRTWPGPFFVTVQAMEDHAADAILGPRAEIPRLDLSKLIPDRDGLYGRGFRDAIESIQLALATAGVPGFILNEAVTTALDAYGNNPVANVEIDEALVVTTGHLRPDEREMMKHDEDALMNLGTGLIQSMAGPHGFSVYVPTPDEARDGGSDLTKRLQVLSPGFAGAVLHAVSLGLKRVIFDADADYLPGVEAYNDDGTVDDSES